MNTDNITVNTQSSIRIEGSKVLYFDPFQIGQEKADADIILITHEHYDHFDPDSIANIMKEDTVLVIPAGMEAEVKKLAGSRQIICMKPGEKKIVSACGGSDVEATKASAITVEAVAAYNKLKPFHPRRNQWLGYIVTMDGLRYYVAGDTDALSELGTIVCDVALLPIGGMYTMTAKDAANLVNVMRPKVAIPTHYGSIVGKAEDADAFRSRVNDGILVVTKL